MKENNYRGHGDSVDQLCWHPTNPDLFVTASGDKTIRIWDVRTTKCIATVNTKGEALVHMVAGVLIHRSFFFFLKHPYVKQKWQI